MTAFKKQVASRWDTKGWSPLIFRLEDNTDLAAVKQVLMYWLLVPFLQKATIALVMSGGRFRCVSFCVRGEAP